MEPIFENITIETEQLIREAMTHLYSKMFRRNSLWWGILTVAFVAIASYRNSWFLWLLAAVYAGFFVWHLFAPWRASRRNYKKLLAFYNQNIQPVTTRFFGDHFEMSSEDSWESISYDKIEAVACLKHCVVVKVKEKSGGYMFSHDGFRKGTPEELIDFLRTKYTQPNPANWNW